MTRSDDIEKEIKQISETLKKLNDDGNLLWQQKMSLIDEWKKINANKV